MRRDLDAPVGFQAPKPHMRARSLALQWATCASLAVLTIIAVAAVTLGYAHAGTGSLDGGGASASSAALLGVLLAAAGVTTALTAIAGRTRR